MKSRDEGKAEDKTKFVVSPEFSSSPLNTNLRSVLFRPRPFLVQIFIDLERVVLRGDVDAGSGCRNEAVRIRDSRVQQDVRENDTHGTGSSSMSVGR
jgi:hypothetical protein